MLSIPALSSSLQIATGGTAGVIAGAAYFAALHVNARWYAHHALGAALVMQVLRFGLLALMLYGLARLGSAALLSGLAGIVVARHVATRLLERTP
ncbi:ATP synthase subunit I [Burkholderia sp. BCC1644]|uniref:N-ATPase subunit AtpR n=1 Tax=Burkholderia sp. BCC1644 TaxID=2676293 RepID=UPI0015904A48|nr:ATP synthase subunit I [Burkholderia sp. BCC1644]